MRGAGRADRGERVSTSFRSAGWSVRPSFVPHGATSPVTLLGDGHGLTQLSGTPEVAWQTPWSELSSMQLLRFSRGMALFATVDGVRYCWRKGDRRDYDETAAVVLEHGGRLIRQRRRAGLVAVVVVVLLASLAGGLGAFFSRNAGAQELADAKAVNLTLRDLPSGWYTANGSFLEYLFPPAKDVITPTTTTLPAKDSAFAQVSAQFESCLGVSAKRDRVYGAAGQQPDYQVSSPIFGSSSDGGIEAANITQYYATTTMVKNDTAEMSMKKFGGCFVASNAALILSGYKSDVPTVSAGTNWRPLTFVHGWARGGVTTLSEPGVKGTLHLVMVVATAGHYEVTLGVLVEAWPEAQSLIANLVSTLKSRITTSNAAAA
jgi:hypothetical protein